MTGLSVGDVKIWNLPSGREVACLPVDCACAWRIAFSRDGRRLAAACGVHTFAPAFPLEAKNARVKVWDVETQLETLHIEGSLQPFRCVAFSPDGMSLLACDRSGTLSLFGRQSAAWSVKPAKQPD
jgi:WD40 repeat protein